MARIRWAPKHGAAIHAVQVFIQLPEEDPRYKEPGACGKLEMVLQGTRDAVQIFEDTVYQVCVSGGARQGTFRYVR